jgi:hypothetical protein
VNCAQTTCLTPFNNCQASDCPAATSCVNGCANSGTCIAGCLNGYPNYDALIECLFQSCTSVCGIATPIANCPVSDAGPG